jgi:hypothetical protein
MKLNITNAKQKDKNMKTRNAQEINDRYNAVKTDIANLLGFFECELSKDKPVLDWSGIGTLQKVRDDLVSTLAFFSGFSEDQINETLEDARIDNQTA